MSGNSLTYRILGDPSSAIKAMHRTRAEVDKSTKGIRNSFKKLAGISAGISLAGFAKSAVDEARESQKVNAQTGAVLKSTGQAAGVSAKRVGDLATSISNYAGIDDEAIQAGENMLLTFTQIRDGVGKGNDVFDQATKAATDMAVAMGQDVKSAALQVGKALNDPIKGVTKLTKVGVVFTEQQKAQITAMTQAGNVAGAQKVILGELQREFGGSAAAQATAADKAKVAFGNLEEQVGTALIPVLDDFAHLMSDDVVPALSATFGWLDKHKTEVKIVAGVVGGMWVAWKGYTAIKGVAQGVKLAIATMKADALALRTRFRVAATGVVASEREIALASTATRNTVVANNSTMVRSARLGGVALAGLAVAGPIAAAIPDQLNVTDQIVGYTKLHGAISDSAKAFFDWVAASKANAGALKSTWLFDAPGLIDKVGGKLGPLEQAIGGSDAAWAKFKKTQLHGFSGDQLGYLDEFHKRWKETSVAIDGATGSTKKLGGAQDKTGKSGRTLKEIMAEVNAELAKQHERMQQAITDTLELTNSRLGEKRAELQFKDGLASLSATAKENGRSLDVTTKAGRANREALIDQLSALQDVASSQAQNGKTLPQVARAWFQNERALRKAAAAAGYNKDQVDKLFGSLERGTRHRFRVALDADLSKAKAQLAAYKVWLREQRFIISVDGRVSLRGGVRPAGYASGTGGASPGWRWVGERGPELMRFKGGEQVLSHPSSMALAGAGGYAHGTTTVAALPAGGLRVAGGRLEVGRDAAGQLEAWVRDIVLDEADHSATIGRMRR